jgi:hypothetical protein
MAYWEEATFRATQWLTQRQSAICSKITTDVQERRFPSGWVSVQAFQFTDTALLLQPFVERENAHVVLRQTNPLADR